MEKYGVVVTARDLCPLCDTPLVRSGAVLRCPEHGTKPLETVAKPITSTHGVDTVGTGDPKHED